MRRQPATLRLPRHGRISFRRTQTFRPRSIGLRGLISSGMANRIAGRSPRRSPKRRAASRLTSSRAASRTTGILIISGFQFAAPGYTQAVSWLYATRFPALIPGQTASIPLISANYWRGEGADYFAPTSTQGQQADLFQQWSQDVATKSTFPGSIASGVLTLTAAATGPMWEGEVVDCVTISGGCPLNQEFGRLHHVSGDGRMGCKRFYLRLIRRRVDHGDRLDAERRLLSRAGASILFRSDE